VSTSEKICFEKVFCPHPLTPSPKLVEGELENLLPSPKIGRGAVLVRVKPRKHALPNFYVKLTPMDNYAPLQIIPMKKKNVKDTSLETLMKSGFLNFELV